MTAATGIPDGFAPVLYLSDPDAETLMYGTELQDGMVVLIEGEVTKPDPDKFETMHVYERKRLLESGRWCQVSSLRVVERGHDANYSPLIKFIGTYADGSQMTRTYDGSYAWFVKRSSIPAVQS